MKRRRTAYTLTELRKIGVFPLQQVPALPVVRPFVLLQEGYRSRVAYRLSRWDEAGVLPGILEAGHVAMVASAENRDVAPGLLQVCWRMDSQKAWQMRWTAESSWQALLEILYRVLATAGLPCPLAIIREWWPGADLMGTQLALLQKD